MELVISASSPAAVAQWSSPQTMPSEDKRMLHSSHRSDITIRGSLRTGSNVRSRWPLALLLLGLILMASFAPPAAYGGGIVLSSSVRQNLLSLQSTADLLATTQAAPATTKTQSAATTKTRLHDVR